MASDFLPGSDADLDNWLANFGSRLSADTTTYGFTPTEVTQLSTSISDYSSAFERSRAASDAAKSATADKRSTREQVVSIVRPFARRLQAHPAMTDTVRGLFGLTMQEVRPVSGVRASTVPQDVPLLHLDFGTRGQITVHFGPNPGNENRNGLPTGAIGAVIQTVALNPVEPAANLDGLTGWQWLDNATSSPFVHVLTPSAARVVAYRVAYLYRRGRRGPWSAAMQAAATF
jgi:hypothetical protein